MVENMRKRSNLVIDMRANIDTITILHDDIQTQTYKYVEGEKTKRLNCAAKF